jgi:hypothetical protein
MDGKVTIELSDAEALVLFDWIKRFNEMESNDFEDQAEERVLWNLEALLEKRLVVPLTSEYKTLLMKARDRMRDDK